VSISQKCQYALRAVLELARRHGSKPTSIREIAEAQRIPPKFLASILGQLRQGGFVLSRRGVRGGYTLVEEPAALAAGKVIRFIDGPLAPVRCVGDQGSVADCPLHGDCALLDMWARARDAVSAVYDGTTFQDLLDARTDAVDRRAVSYTI